MPVDVAHRRESPAAGRTGVGTGLRAQLAELLPAAWCWLVLGSVTLVQYGRGLLFASGREAWDVVLGGWARSLISLGGMQVQVEGALGVEGAAVLVANHQSAFDVVLMAALVSPPFSFVARAELFSVPIVGGVLRRGGHIAVGHGDGADPASVVGRIVERLEGGSRVIVFAEGTRSEGGEVRRLRAGAFQAARVVGCPLVPVALAGTRHVVSKGRRLLRPARMAVSFLEPVTVTGEVAAPRGREALRRRLAAAVRALEPSTGPRLGRRG